MSRELIIEPGKVTQWPEFIEQAEPYSIAGDGRVPGKNNYHLSGDRAPIISVDHHSEVDRLGTRATCDQLLQMMRMGLRRRYTRNGLYVVNFCVNDPDQDVCTSWYILNHPDVAEKANANPALNRLVAVESLLDATGGMYPFDRDLGFLGVIKAIYRPYTDFRNGGGIAEQDPEQFRRVIFDVERRITDFIVGNPPEAEPLKTAFDVERAGSGWSMIREQGEDSRFAVVSSGIQAFVSITDTKDDGIWRYTIGRTSPFIDFPIEELYAELNKHDPACTEDNQWGGSDLIGGSPRSTGSKLSPEQVFEITEALLETRRKATNLCH